MLFRARSLLASAILIVPFMAGSSLSAVFGTVIWAIRNKQLNDSKLLLLLVAVVVLLAATLLIGRFLWRSSEQWMLIGMSKRPWLGFLIVSFFMGVMAGQFFVRP